MPRHPYMRPMVHGLKEGLPVLLDGRFLAVVTVLHSEHLVRVRAYRRDRSVFYATVPAARLTTL